MKNTHPHPVEVLLVAAWLAVEAIAVLLTALVALLLAVLSMAKKTPPKERQGERTDLKPKAPDISADLRESLPVAEAAAPPAEHPLALLADALQQLPHRELMTMAGTRRRLPKYQLAAMVAACS